MGFVIMYKHGDDVTFVVNEAIFKAFVEQLMTELSEEEK